MTQDGVSVLICCHNSLQLLPNTLECLFNQRNAGEIPWEILVIDNGSSDGTAEFARSKTKESQAPLRIFHEPKLGLTYARKKGLENAVYEYVSFIDDDNWVEEEWVSKVYQAMSVNNQAGLLGGKNTPCFQAPPPAWFEECQDSFAVGSQAPESGDVTWSRGYLWGAGLTIRKSAWEEMVKDGYQPILIDRRGLNLSSGGDTELCLAMRLAGWKMLYDGDINLTHYIPMKRLNWGYIRQLNRNFGRANVIHDIYRKVQEYPPSELKGRLGRIWTLKARNIFGILIKDWEILFRCARNPCDGEFEILETERYIGMFLEYLRKRDEYDRDYERIWAGKWRKI